MSDMVEKWGKAIAARGFAQVPNHLLLLNQFLLPEKRLSPTELLVLVQIVATWWRKDEMPFPALKTLAARAGVSDRQAQRAVSRLEGAGLLKRVRRSSRGMVASNAYDLTPLVDFLGEVAKAFPNEFPRKIEAAKLKELGSSLSQPLNRDKAAPPAQDAPF